MVGMIARQGTDAKLAEKLPFVQHLVQHPAKFRFVEDRSHSPTADANRRRIVNRGGYFRSGRQESPQSLTDIGIFLQQFTVKDRGGAQREQSHHRSDFQPLGLAVGQAQDVVKKSVLLVPHPRVAAHVPHRRGDPQEVLEEFDGHVGVIRIGQCQLRGDFQHVLTE